MQCEAGAEACMLRQLYRSPSTEAGAAAAGVQQQWQQLALKRVAPLLHKKQAETSEQPSPGSDTPDPARPKVFVLPIHTP